MARSFINVVNTSAQTAAANDQINFGSVNRRFGSCLMLQGLDVQAIGNGYYEFLASVTVAPSAIGTVKVSLLANGVEIPGANASATVAAIGDVQTITVPGSLRINDCCNKDAVVAITAVIDSAGTISNATLTGEKK